MSQESVHQTDPLTYYFRDRYPQKYTRHYNSQYFYFQYCLRFHQNKKMKKV